MESGSIDIEKLDIISNNYFNSLVIQFPSHTTLSNASRHIVDKLICSQINSPKGICLSLDTPLNNPPMLNILRPAVLRQYYGLNVKDVTKQNHTVERYTYGSGSGTSSVGIDPNNFVTREMTEEMNLMSIESNELLIKNKSYFKLDNANLDLPFNHCTVLVYYAGECLKKHARLGMHSDCVYSVHNGSYVKKDNSQVENTPTVVYSLGDTRSLHWSRRKRIVTHKGRYIWECDKEFKKEFTLSTDSITVVNTLDEDPEYTSIDGSKYQYQHGNVNVSKDQLSVGIVFRTVHSTAVYDLKSDCIIRLDGEPNDIVHYHLGTNLNDFHSKLINLYHDVMF